jgi:hypothetical protein
MTKYTFIPILIFTSIFLSSTFVAKSQEIPNNSLENWAEAAEGHEDPVSWGTANSTTNTFPIFKITTEKTTDAYDGDFAAMLSSKTILTFVAPGFITLGQFDIDLFTQVTSITGGINFSLHPDRLKLWYKYAPAGEDSFRIGLWMLRDDGTDIPDTVATALSDISLATSEYIELVIDIEYRSVLSSEILNIIAVSSNPDNPVAGSILYVDKFELEYNTGIISNDDNKLNVFPNPAGDIILIDEYFNGNKYKVLDLSGKMLLNGISNSNNIDINCLSNGTYLISIEKDGLVHSQKFIKQ